jgi:hypothetical protein
MQTHCYKITLKIQKIVHEDVKAKGYFPDLFFNSNHLADDHSST